MERFNIQQDEIGENVNELSFDCGLEIIKDKEQVRQLLSEEFEIKDEEDQGKMFVDSFNNTEGEIANYDCPSEESGSIRNTFQDIPSVSTVTDKNLNGSTIRIHKDISSKGCLSYPLKVDKQTQTGEKEQPSTSMPRRTIKKPFACNVCKYVTTNKTSLHEHMRAHTGERPFQCKICSYNFSKKGDLTIHMRHHTGERPYQCIICNNRFITRKQLVAHMKSHTGERVFSCNICNCDTISNSNLVSHMKMHHVELQLHG